VQRLSLRLTLLLLAVVAVLALTTAVLLWRGLDALLLAPDGTGGVLADADPEAVGAVARGTLINLAVVVAVTVIAAVAFSRALLADPIAQLTAATRALAAGDRTVRLPVRDRSELGELATAFNAMADALTEAQQHLESRVAVRTAELRALLELSNTIAVTTELQPLLAAVLDRLDEAGATVGAEVWELGPDAACMRLVARGGGLPEAAPLPCTDEADPVFGELLTLPLRVRERTVGVLRAVAPERAPWDEERLRLAVGVAAQAAVAIENVRLYERVRDEATDEARRHLARELHDSVSQAIYAIVLTTHAAQRRAERDPTKAGEALDTVIELAEAALAEMRALIFELRPEALAEVGLVGALHRQLDGLELRHGLATSRELLDEPDLPFASKQVLLRVVQEALHNVVKHAHASSVRIGAHRAGGRLHLQVRDDGVGFDPAASFPGHLGHTSMRERLAALGGRLRLESAPGAGTTVSLDVPLAGAGARAAADDPRAVGNPPAGGAAVAGAPPGEEALPGRQREP
jgi:signal transduction histidine kinase